MKLVPPAFIEEPGLCKGHTEMQVLGHSLSISYLATYLLCVPSISTKVFIKDIFKGLTIKLDELREKKKEQQR